MKIDLENTSVNKAKDRFLFNVLYHVFILDSEACQYHSISKKCLLHDLCDFRLILEPFLTLREIIFKLRLQITSKTKVQSTS